MTISVIIPFYNLERYVDACLGSVLSAPHTCELEVICVDDGSTDSTGAKLDAYDVKVIHKPNGGEGSARNAGLAAATGDYVTFLDGDDVWLKNHLEVAEREIAAHPTAEIIGLKYLSFDDGAAIPEPTKGEASCVFETTRHVPDEVILEIGVFPTFFKREFLAGRRFSALPLGADRLFMAECFASATSVVWAPVGVHGYRVRAGSMARAVWNARKVTSQCDYAYGALKALVGSGKTLGRVAQSYLASLWLSDVPNRLGRLKRGAEKSAAFARWRETLADARVVAALPRFDRARRVLKECAGETLTLMLAHLLRKGGLT